MKFLICLNQEGGMFDYQVDSPAELVQAIAEDRYHIPGEELPIGLWADHASIGDRFNYSKGVIIAVSGRVKP
jgi:hypothetical protein